MNWPGLFLCCLSFLLGTLPAGANPWPREKGQVFIAATGTYRYDHETRLAEGDAGFTPNTG